MLLVFYLLLMLTVGRTSEEQIFETKTVGLGQNVTLSCERKKSLQSAELYWIRIVSKNWPEVLGATFSFDYESVNKTPHITAKQEPGAFILHINQTQPSDTGLYYCIKVSLLNMTILTGTFLRTKESDITAVIQASSPHLVRPGEAVTLQCSVLSDSEKKTCPGENSVFWFRAGSDESHPSLIYAHGNSADDCEKSPEAQSPQSCVYSFSKDISPSDNETYYCALATCGEILFRKRTKLDVEVVSAANMWDLQKTNTILLVLCAALAFSLIVFAFLIYTIKNKPCSCCNAAAVVLERNAAAASDYQQNQQRNEDSVVYSAPTFTKKKAGKAERRNVKAAEGEMVYSDVRTFVID